VHKLVYLSLGSNLGDPAANLNTAITGLRALGEVAAVSSFYETEPVELTAQPWFLNCAIKLDTEKMPKQLMSGILDFDYRDERSDHPSPSHASASLCARTVGRDRV